MNNNTLTYSQLVNLEVASLEKLDHNSSVVFFIDESKKTSSYLNEYDTIIKKLFEKYDFNGKKGESIDFTQTTSSGEISTFIFVGIGNKISSREELKSLAIKVIDSHKKFKTENLSICIEKNLFPTDEGIFFLEELFKKTYNFNKYFVEKKDSQKSYLKKLIINTDISEISANLDKIKNKIFGITITRDLVMEPSNVIYPESIKKIVEQLTEFGIEIEILDKKKMESENMNLLLSVAKGSDKTPYTIILKWNGDKNKNFSENLISIIGKGVTFDSGGINIKQNPTNMKCDMAGAAAVIGTMISLAKNNIKKNVIGAIGLVENMPSGNAMKPDDVIYSMSGKTVEIDNTDAEGRLVLADVIEYIQKYYKPKYMVDLATLTGAIMIALGSYYAGLFSNNDEFASQILVSGKNTNDKVWRLPLADHYDKMNDSHIADIKNCAREVGSTTAAQFLKRFVNKDVIWAHIDIAGTAYDDKGKIGTTSTSRATGFGVSLLYDLIENLKQ